MILPQASLLDQVFRVIQLLETTGSELSVELRITLLQLVKYIHLVS